MCAGIKPQYLAASKRLSGTWMILCASYNAKLWSARSGLRISIAKVGGSVTAHVIVFTHLYRCTAYVVFGKPEHGLTKDEFREMIFRLGMVVTDDQMDLIMDHFDTDSACQILCNGCECGTSHPCVLATQKMACSALRNWCGKYSHPTTPGVSGRKSETTSS